VIANATGADLQTTARRGDRFQVVSGGDGLRPCDSESAENSVRGRQGGPRGGPRPEIGPKLEVANVRPLGHECEGMVGGDAFDGL